MRRYLSLFIAALLLINFFGCSKDESTKPEPTPVNEFNLLTDYLENDGGNYINTTAPKIVSAADVAADLSAYTILDIRGADAYNAGHIPGAINVTLGGIVDYAEANLNKTDKILVACYTGQSAGHAVLALNLLGYDAYSLLFGMSSWNADFDSWTNNCNSGFEGQFTTNATALNDAGDYPTIETGEETGEAILKARVDAILAAGFKGKSASDVLANPGDYYIVNYFTQDQYTGQEGCPPGHIQGAYQYTPKASLSTTAQLKNLPTDKPIVVYCWTGQNSSQVTAFLNVLGYEAYSLKFGVNGMVHDQLTGHKWDPNTMIGGFAYDTGTAK